jgi:mannose-1-phosphate guanylyltransferase
LGTAGTLRANSQFFKGSTVLLAHADNFCQCDFMSFIRYHQTARPENTALTMMTFDTTSPETCGIIESNRIGVVTSFHEKVADPPGNRANGAVYLLEPEVLEWVGANQEITDFSTQVLPKFINRIATWHNSGIHVDIGNIQALRIAQNLAKLDYAGQTHNSLSLDDEWTQKFAKHPIQQQVVRQN